MRQILICSLSPILFCSSLEQTFDSLLLHPLVSLSLSLSLSTRIETALASLIFTVPSEKNKGDEEDEEREAHPRVSCG